ncbi:MAG TPA: carbohydrate porin [Nitrospiria bacterium]|jgi:hypothetical protein
MRREKIFRGFLVFLLFFLFFYPQGILAQGESEVEKELKEIKERLKELEQEKIEVTDEDGHRLHPVRSLYGATISGGLTAILQGSLNNKERFGGDHSEASISADLILEYGFGEESNVLFRLDWAPADGLGNLPPLLVNPNGNPSGPNADIEGLTTLHLVEARYEHRLLDEAILIAFGQMDLTSYFDSNHYANSERDQFLAQQFVNNTAIEWGGDENFLGPGVVLGLNSSERVGVLVGFFEGDGNYKDFFDNPFLIGQLSIQTQTGGRDGNVRLYGWGRLTDHCNSASDLSIFSDCTLILPADQNKRQDQNTGFGFSLDQQVSGGIGVWSRFGYQDPDVSQFEFAVSGGAGFSGEMIGRPDDELGVAYGASFPSGPYELATGFNDVEHYGELYYRMVPFGDGRRPEIQISPDIQIIANPGGDRSVDPVFIWGFRTQVNF